MLLARGNTAANTTATATTAPDLRFGGDAVRLHHRRAYWLASVRAHWRHVLERRHPPPRHLLLWRWMGLQWAKGGAYSSCHSFFRSERTAGSSVVDSTAAISHRTGGLAAACHQRTCQIRQPQ